MPSGTIVKGLDLGTSSDSSFKRAGAPLYSFGQSIQGVHE
jgi:hypothetical protein